MSRRVSIPVVEERYINRKYGIPETRTILGSGGTGTVYRAIDRETMPLQTVVIKEIPKTLYNAQTIAENEATLLTAIESVCRAYFVCLIEMKQTPNAYYLVENFLPNTMDLRAFMDHSPVYQKLFHEKPQNLVRVAQDIVKAVDVLHRLGIAHRDIKPDNFLIFPEAAWTEGKSSTVRLIDFGYSCTGDDCAIKGTFGTDEYFAPELVSMSYKPMDERKWQLADIWSTGLVLFELLTGQHFWEWMLHAPPTAGNIWINLKKLWEKRADAPNAQTLASVLASFHPKSTRVALGNCLATMIQVLPELRSLPRDLGGGCTLPTTRRPRGGDSVDGLFPFYL